jgi:predicted amidohydrolase YtcJ
MLIVNAERYPDRSRIDLRVVAGRIVAVGNLTAQAGERVIDAAGGALLPGLHDHHLHLFALAARRSSILCGPPDVADADQLGDRLAAASRASPGNQWLRGVGYHETVAGSLDRHRLDALVPDRPLRIEHASGTMWFLNSAGLEALGLPGQDAPAGVERDASGEATGRLFRVDAWLRARLGAQAPPDLAAVSGQLAAYGITGVTDTTPTNDDATAATFAAAAERGALRQRVRLMGDEGLTCTAAGPRVLTGELKILLDEAALPELDPLVDRVRRAHQRGRGVAFHCVTRVELFFALRALLDAGATGGDRIEHASLTPTEALPLMRQAGVTVVTQPGLVGSRGDRYLAEVPVADHPHLYRLNSLLEEGVPLGLSTDAPYGDADPWRAMRAAVSRRTPSGALLGVGERLTPEAALGGFLTRADAPGGALRTVAAGAAADLCLLDCGWATARERLDAGMVALSVVDGAITYERAAP